MVKITIVQSKSANYDLRCGRLKPSTKLASACLFLLVPVFVLSLWGAETYAAGAKLVVTNAFWGASQSNPVTARPGDVNLPLTILIANSGDDFARDVNATLYLTNPLIYHYYVGDRRFTASSVSKSAGDISPAATFPFVFTLSIDPNSKEGVFRQRVELQYQSARELSRINSAFDIDIPIWRGDIRIQRIATAPTKVFPGDTQVGLKTWVVNTGQGTTKDLELKLDLKAPFKPSSSGSDRVFLGSVPPGIVGEADFKIDIDKDARFGDYRVTLLANQGQAGFTPLGELTLFLNEKVKFQIVDVSPSSLSSGGVGIIVRITLRNTGTIAADSVRLQLRGGNFFSGTLTDYLGAFNTGEEKTAFLTIDVDSKASAGQYRMDIRLDWSQSDVPLNDTISVTLSVGPPALPLVPIAVGVIILIALVGFLVRRRRRAEPST